MVTVAPGTAVPLESTTVPVTDTVPTLVLPPLDTGVPPPPPPPQAPSMTNIKTNVMALLCCAIFILDPLFSHLYPKDPDWCLKLRRSEIHRRQRIVMSSTPISTTATKLTPKSLKFFTIPLVTYLLPISV